MLFRYPVTFVEAYINIYIYVKQSYNATFYLWNVVFTTNFMFICDQDMFRPYTAIFRYVLR
jgi:hypothetical protein